MNKGKQILTIAVSVCSLGMLASCGSETKTELPYGKNLAVEVLYNGSESVELPEGFVPTMTLDSARVMGSTGINRYFGGFTFEETTGAIKFAPIGMTMMAGPNMDKEDVFVKALNATRYIKMEKDSSYILMDSLKNDLIKFREAEATPEVKDIVLPEGKDMTLTQLFNGEEVIELPEGFTPTIRFEDMKVNGSAGINKYFGDVEFDQITGAIRFNNMGLTKMAGPDMDKEDLFVNALNNARYLNVEEDGTCVLLDSLKHNLVKFR